METLIESQLIALIEKTWREPSQDTEVTKLVAYTFARTLKGAILNSSAMDCNPGEPDAGTIFSIALLNPKYKITDDQVALIMDHGNHCLSEGTIKYINIEDNDIAFIQWSNLGHL